MVFISKLLNKLIKSNLLLIKRFIEVYHMAEPKLQTLNKNKGFTFAKYDVVVFDLDCSLLRYNMNEMIPLVYTELNKFLVEKKDYPSGLLNNELNWDFLQKNLVMDMQRGNILKLNYESALIKAAHGTRPLSKEEISEIYSKNQEWDVATKFYDDPLETWNGPLSLKIRATLDYFDISAPLVFANVVDLIDSTTEEPTADYTKYWLDILDGLYYLFLNIHFQNDISPFFAAIKECPARFLMKTNDKVLEQINKLRERGKLVCLLTGSDIDYANFTCSYALGPDWQTLFDCVIGYAKKPAFFTQNRQFYNVKDNVAVPEDRVPLDQDLELNKAYCGGNWKQLLKALGKKLNKSPSELHCLHIGDNIIQDIYTPVRHFEMDAVAISEELYENKEDFVYRHVIHSEFWGSNFLVDGQNTLLSAFLCNYANIIIPNIDVLGELPIDAVVPEDDLIPCLRN